MVFIPKKPVLSPLEIPLKEENNSFKCSINWIYIGPAPKGADVSLIALAPKQFARIYTEEKTCLWVLTDNVEIFSDIFKEEILRGRFIIKIINWLELISSPRVMHAIEKMLPDIFSIAPLSRTELFNFFEHNLEWFFEVTTKISAGNLVKELFLPLIMAYQVSLDTAAHYFDLSVFIAETNPLKLSSTENNDLPKECVEYPWEELKSMGRLPSWPHIKIPIKEIPKIKRETIRTFIHAKQYREILSFVNSLGMDVWWLYTFDDEISLDFYVEVYLRSLKNFLLSFPDLRSILRSRQPISDFFGPDKKLLLSLPQATKLNIYISSMLACVILDDRIEKFLNSDRGNKIANIFFYAYNETTANFLIKNSHFLTSPLSIFSLCFDILSLSILRFDHQGILPDISQAILRLNGGIDDEFLRRFSNKDNTTFWSSEVGYYKNVGGSWQIKKQFLGTERERNFLKRYFESHTFNPILGPLNRIKKK